MMKSMLTREITQSWLSWIDANIVPIFKKRNRGELRNYSLLVPQRSVTEPPFCNINDIDNETVSTISNFWDYTKLMQGYGSRGRYGQNEGRPANAPGTGRCSTTFRYVPYAHREKH